MTKAGAQSSGKGLLSNVLESTVSRRDLAKKAAVAATATGLAGSTMGLLGQSAAMRALAQDSKPTGGSIIVARAGDSDTLDPAHTTAGIAFQVFTNIFDTLVAYDGELGYEGILAESWEISEDGLEYTFKLREGIQFHDGTDFNADAVKFTYDRLMLPETNAPAAGWISPLSGTEVVDPLTVKLVLSEPFSPLLGNLCLAYFGILSPAAVEQYGDADFGRNPVGTGPWKFQEWIAGEQITLVANESYQNFHTTITNKGRPFADELIFRNISEDATQIAAIETGEVTIIPMPAREVSRFQEDDQFQVLIPERATNIWFLEWSMEPPTAESDVVLKPGFFEDVLVRQAVAYAVNADEIIESVWQGLAVRNSGLLPTGHFAYKPEIEEFGYQFDQEKAKALLDEAGWVEGDGGVREKDGVKMEPLLWTSNAGNNERSAQVIQNQLSAVGIAVKIESLEIATLFARQAENICDFVIMSWGWPEPHVMKMMVDGDAGLGLYRRAEYLELVDEAARVSEQADRTELYFQANQVALQDVAAVPLWTTLAPIGARAELKDFLLGPTGTNLYEDAYFED